MASYKVRRATYAWLSDLDAKWEIAEYFRYSPGYQVLGMCYTWREAFDYAYMLAAQRRAIIRRAAINSTAASFRLERS